MRQVRAAAVWLYRTLLKLYPVAFRADFERDLIAHLQSELDSGVRTRIHATAAFWLAETWDLLRNLPGAWLERTPGARRRSARGATMDGWTKDLGYAFRGLRRRPGFALIAIVTMGVGIGANTAMYGVIDAVLVRPFPYPEPDELVFLRERYREDQGKALSYLNWQDWRARNRVFEGLGARAGWSFTITGDGPATQLPAYLVSHDLFDVLGVAPVLGRSIDSADEAVEARVVVISDDLWRERFGGDRSVLDRTIRLDGEPYEVVGVMPARLDEPLEGADVFAPITTLSPGDRASRSSHPGIYLFGRLRDGVTLAEARADMERVTGEVAEEYPAANRYAGADMVSLRDRYLANARTALGALAGAVGLLLLLVCANVANLFLSRSVGRAREAAVRTALGATRARVARLLLAESAVVALAGGVFGFLLAFGGLELVKRAEAVELPRLSHLEVDPGLFAVALLLAGVAGLAAGLLPAVQLSADEPSRALRDGERGTSGRRGRTARRWLVVGEVAVATVLLVGAALMTRSVANLVNHHPGMDTDRVLVARVPITGASYPEVGHRVTFYRELTSRVEALPGVASVAAVDPVPLGFGNRQSSLSGVGLSTVDDDEGLRVDIYTTTPDYFATMRIPILAGSGFTGNEAPEDFRIVVDETLAARLWPGEAPGSVLGRVLRFRGDDAPPMTVIGVAGHVRHYGLREQGREQLYRPFTLGVWDLILVVRTEVPPLQLAPAVRSVLAALDPRLPLSGVDTMEGLLDRSIAEERLVLRGLGLFGLVAAGLALLGLYGVVSFDVAARTREMGIRIALGARRERVVRRVVGEGVGLASVGVAVGAVASLATAGVLEGLLFDVRSTEPATLATVAVGVVAMATVATLLPARRVTAIDPTEALRSE